MGKLYNTQVIDVGGGGFSRPLCPYVDKEGGLVENNGYLQISESYENHGTLANGAGATARLVLSARNTAELKAALACENPG